MKTLANCQLREFLVQTNKIRHEVFDFYQSCVADVISQAREEYAESEKTEETLHGVGLGMVDKILDACLEKDIDKTIRTIGLCCFMSPEEAEALEPADLFDIVYSLIGSKRVQDFFTKLVELVRKFMVKE